MRSAVFDGPSPSLRPLIVSEDALRGHAQTSTLVLARALAERGVGVRLVFGADGPAAEDARAAGVTVLDLAPWSGRRSQVRGVAATLCSGSGLFHPVHLSSMGARAVRAGTAALRRGVPTVAHVRSPDDVEAALRLHDRGAHVVVSSAAALCELVSRGAHRVERFADGADGVDADAAVAPSSRAAVPSGLQTGGPDTTALLADAWPHRSHEAYVGSVVDLYWRMTGLRGRPTPGP